jgi:hypothetical protein
MRNTYINDNVTYGSVGRKWLFGWVGNTLLVECRGKAMADKVAHVVNGSIKRNGLAPIDGLARSMINKLTRPVID